MPDRPPPERVPGPGVWARARTACATHALDAAVFGGCSAIVYGVAQIYSPLAWIVAGMMALMASAPTIILSTRDQAVRPDEAAED